jgi:hypothetical protein
MSRRIFAAPQRVLSVAIVGLALPAAAEVRPVDANELARCAAISSGNERLACYDALAVVAVPGIQITPATVASAAGGTAAPATVPAPGAGAPAPATGTAAVPAAHSANPDDPANFGLTQQQLKAAPAGPASIKATVSQITQDRLSHVYLVLDNGQTWGFSGTDARVRPGDAVTIKRAALGSFLMVTPSRHSYRVERLH